MFESSLTLSPSSQQVSSILLLQTAIGRFAIFLSLAHSVLRLSYDIRSFTPYLLSHSRLRNRSFVLSHLTLTSRGQSLSLLGPANRKSLLAIA